MVNAGTIKRNEISVQDGERMLRALRMKGNVPGSEAGEGRPWRALEAMEKGLRSHWRFQGGP